MPIDPGTAMVASGAMQLLGGGASALFGSSEAKRASKRQYRYALNYDLHGPTYKVKGLRDAGINPIIAFGAGGQGMTPAYQGSGQMAPGIDVDMPDLASTAQALSGAELNYKKAKTEIEKKLLTRVQQGVAQAEEKKLLEEFWVLTQEFNYVTQKAYLTLDERKMLAKKMQVLEMQMNRIKEQTDVYDGPLGEIISYINAILGTINLGVMAK